MKGYFQILKGQHINQEREKGGKKKVGRAKPKGHLKHVPQTEGMSKFDHHMASQASFKGCKDNLHANICIAYTSKFFVITLILNQLPKSPQQA